MSYYERLWCLIPELLLRFRKLVRARECNSSFRKKLWSGPVWCNAVRYSVVRLGAVRYGLVRSGVVRYGRVRCGKVWFVLPFLKENYHGMVRK